ncbi:unnamed protein product [Prunus armeniaca]
MKLFIQNPAVNMAEFTNESTEEQEEEGLQEEVLDFAPAALDDSLPEVEDPLQEINLGTEEDPRPIFISALLEEPLKSEIIALLHNFRDCFAWHYHAMPGLDKKLVEHKLAIKEGYLPVKQARRRMYMDTELKVKEEIERNLNEASPKDEYPMPMADLLMDGAAHNQMLSFMDGNAGYNQIMVAEEDIHKTALMCPGHIGAFEYTVMPSVLRNAGATYQRAMNSVFQDMIGHSLEPFSSSLRLKQEQTFKWEEQHQQAFEEIKNYLSNVPVLSPPKRGRPLKLYVSASEVSIGSLLVQDNKEGKEQIDLIKYMLTRPMLRGRIGKWTMALTEFAFRYVPQKAIEGQAVTDFLADHP